MAQLEGETIDKYVTRLKDKASRCGFTDVNKEIKHQIVFSCNSRKVRRKALSDDPTLEELIKYARSIERTTTQANIIENESQESEVNKVGRKPGKYSKRYADKEAASRMRKDQYSAPNDTEDQKCYFCGGKYPHSKGRTSCPAYGKKCSRCKRSNHFAQYCMSTNSEVKKVGSNALSSSESSDSSDDQYAYTVLGEGSDVKRINAKITLKVEDKRMKFQIDTGASVNIICNEDFKPLRFRVKLQKNDIKLYAYGSKKPIPVVGWFVGVIETKNKIDTAKFYVVNGPNMNSLLGLETASTLGVVKVVNTVTDEWNSLHSPLREIVSSKKKIFKGIGKLKDVKVTLAIKPEIKPVANKHRRIPFHLREKVDAELDRLTRAGIIEAVENPTGWVSPVVISNKSNGEIRLCIDMTEPNKAIDRVRHVIPTVDDIRYQVNGAKIFSKVDLKNGYHQLELEENSRDITTFSTHRGLSRFCRLNFGTNSAAEIFHNEISKRTENIKGALSIHDDILIFGSNQEDHDNAVKDVLTMIEENHLTVNGPKCEFSKQTIKFYGLIFSEAGVSPDPGKIEALRKAEAPKTKSELRSFLGMVSFSADFIDKFSEHTAVLRKLTHAKEKWEWKSHHQKAFEQIKEKLSEDTMLKYFDPKYETEVICDGSPEGVSGILTQTNPTTGERNVIAYASRMLSDAETRYGQVEREALAIHFACLKFQIYLLGKRFSVATDHKPLVYMFNRPRTQVPYRVERMRMKLQGFEFTVRHLPGINNPSDFMSRKPIPIIKEDKKMFAELEKHVHRVIKTGLFDAVSLDEIRESTSKDPVMKTLYGAIERGWLDTKRYPEVALYKPVFKSFSIIDGIIAKRHKIVIPSDLRKRIVTAGHDGHQGIDKTKRLLRSKIWYPTMDKDIEKAVSNCRGCQAAVNDTSREPLIMSEMPQAPWESVVTDYYGPLATGDYLIVLIDEYTRFPIVKITSSTSSKAAIPKYDEIFSEFGIPARVRSDNGSPYNSEEFANYSKYMGFQHKPVMPLYPQANGMAEKFNTALTKVLMTSNVLKTNWKQELYKFLRNYRCTPHSTTGKAPAELLFSGRTFRTRIPELPRKIDDSELRKKDRKNKERIKKYADSKANVKPCLINVGDMVLVKKRRKRKSDPYYDPQPYRVVRRKGNMVTARRKDHAITRNTSFYKRIEKNERDDELYHSDDFDEFESIRRDDDTDQNEDIRTDVPPPPARRSNRATGQPIRYPMDVV